MLFMKFIIVAKKKEAVTKVRNLVDEVKIVLILAKE
jgi:hypothetical protein